MSEYSYIAKIDPQNTLHSDIEAESEADAVNKLIKMGYYPLVVKLKSFKSGQAISGFLRDSKKDTVLFTRQLSSLIGSGVDIIKGLNIISAQSVNKYLKPVFSDLIGKIKDGRSLSDSLKFYPQLFSPLYCALVKVGEASGDLNGILKRLSDFLEEEEEFRSSFKGALVYPIFIIGVGAATIFALLTFVIPKLSAMFEDMGQSLPLPTKILINLSGFLRDYWWFIFIISGMAVFLFRRFIALTRGRIAWDTFKIKLAFTGPLILKSEIGRFCRTLSLLLSSGIPISSGLDISASVVENYVLKFEIQRFKEQVINGASLSSAFKNSEFFPEFVMSIISIGEESGTLSRSLMRVADDYEGEISRSLKVLMRLLEPVIILVMGLVVAFIVVAMLLPIFEINLMAQ